MVLMLLYSDPILIFSLNDEMLILELKLCPCLRDQLGVCFEIIQPVVLLTVKLCGYSDFYAVATLLTYFTFVYFVGCRI